MQDIYSIYINALVFFLSGFLLQWKLVPCDVNIDMCSMQELFFFSRVGWDGTLCVPNVFITFKRTKISYYFTSRESEKTIYLNSHRYHYFVVCCLYCLNTLYFWAEIKCIGPMLTVVSFKAVVRSCLFPIGESRCVTRPSNGCKRDCPYSCSPNRKKIRIIRLQLVASKIYSM